MKKIVIKASITALLLSSLSMVFTQTVSAETGLDELQKEKESIEERSNEVEGTIGEQEETLNELDSQRADLESDIQGLQISIGELTAGLEEQSLLLADTNVQIETLQDDIVTLNRAIDKRNEKLKVQARATQTEWNTGSIINTIIAADNLSEVIGHLNIVNRLVSANQMIMADQVRDQQAVVKAEAQMQFEKEAVVDYLEEMEQTRATLASQQTQLDEQITQVVELYNMTSEEKEAFVQEQYALAIQSSEVDGAIDSENERILVEQRLEEEKRLEEERIAEQLLAEKEAEAEQRAEAEAQARREQEEAEQKEASVVAQEKVVAAKQSEVQTSSSPKTDTKKENDHQENKNEDKQTSSKPTVRPAPKPKPEVKPEPVIEEVVETPTQPVSSTPFIRPANGYVSSPFGVRKHPVTGRQTMHNGIDIAGSGAIIAAASGTVTISSYSSSYGYYIKINHGNGYETLYAHLQPNLLVSSGQTVQQGQRIGTMGTTGVSTGVHLHFEVRKNGQFTNPAPYIGF
ncbi:peptidoglycan DD-metalloendopeptidase family protein [Marinilactibacillus kalidii]|uniref:peptidoglycan DD-metalloendopeptidase family protein n=1 Tax=Marinilactibacillus kalidii TaxID=2820274 RepID=UPI001ABDA3E5|nr:peptidoglycan DD-metalloendopeptidase family protein [Marinilactibacillus kalidii]